jgi:hypothetical protein
MCNASGYLGVKCVLHIIGMTFDNCRRWCVVRVCNVSVHVQYACADVKYKWECKFACKFVNVQCKFVSEMHKRVEMRKQVCLWNSHMWVGCEMHVWEWVIFHVDKYVMPMCGTKHANKARKFICNVCKPITRGCNHVMQVCQQIVLLWLSAPAWWTSDGGFCICFAHLQWIALDTYNIYAYAVSCDRVAPGDWNFSCFAFALSVSDSHSSCIR